VNPSALIDYPAGITAVDTGYLRPHFDAAHLIVHGGRAAFVDCGTNSSVPQLLAALEAKGLSRDCVDYLFLTHIHLDHAGGAGLLTQQLPNMKVVVHPRGAQHMATPEKLIAGVKAVYGEEHYRELYGEILPIPAERIIATADGQRLELAGRPFEFIHTPGHAGHHHCIVDVEHGGVFTGDTFGVSYRDFDVEGRTFVIATTSPVQFDPEAMKASLARIVSYQPHSLFLTHYGRITDIARHQADLNEEIEALCGYTRAAAAAHPKGAERTAALEAALAAHYHARLDAHGDRHTVAERYEVLAMDAQLNAQGLEIWFERTEQAR